MHYDYEDYMINVDDTRDSLKDVLEALYSTGDIEALEGALEELCAHLRARLPDTNIKIRKNICTSS